MIYYDERIGCVAVYEANEKLNCLSGIRDRAKVYYYGSGKWKNGAWRVPKRILRKAKKIYRTMSKATYPGR